MEGETVRKVISNLRSPINAKTRIHFTSRSMLFLTKLFEGKRTDTIELHCILLRMAYACGCFREDKNTKYINLKDLAVYLYSQMPPFISRDDISHIADTFSTDIDSDYKEVEDMKIIVGSIEQ